VFNYQAEAAVTESPQFHSELVRMQSLESALSNCILELRKLDKLKKTLFYGKTEHNIGPIPPALDTSAVPALFKNAEGEQLNAQTAIRLIHGIVGVATEACEMLELLFKVVVERKPYDAVNLNEECGDVLWYLACCLNANGATFEEVQRQNIAKLRKRYPNKFTEYDAVNRDVDAERSILEAPMVRVMRDGETDENAGEFLTRLGVDADIWAREYILTIVGKGDACDLDHARAWFANALEAGKSSERTRLLMTTLEAGRLNSAKLAGWLSMELPELKDIEPDRLCEAMQKGFDAVKERG
jgi:NTP pyrophosphatase (non-canonical NTP hydrolase)